MNMLNKYIFDDPMFESRQVEKIFSSPKIETGSAPLTSYLVSTGVRGVVLRLKGAGRWQDNSPPSIADIRKWVELTYISNPPHAFTVHTGKNLYSDQKK